MRVRIRSDVNGGKFELKLVEMAEVSGGESQPLLNPWGSHGNALGLQLGDPARVLTLGKQYGVLPDSEMMDESGEDNVSEFPSILMIRMLKEIADLSSELHQLESQIHRIMLDRETADLVHLDQLEVRLDEVGTLLRHLTDVTNGKEVIQGQLQARRAENSIKIEPSYHKYVHEVMTSLGNAVSATGPNLSVLGWGSHFQLNKTSLAKKLEHGEQSFAQCQAVYQTSQKLHTAMTVQGTQLPPN